MEDEKDEEKKGEKRGGGARAHRRCACTCKMHTHTQAKKKHIHVDTDTRHRQRHDAKIQEYTLSHALTPHVDRYGEQRRGQETEIEIETGIGTRRQRDIS